MSRHGKERFHIAEPEPPVDRKGPSTAGTIWLTGLSGAGKSTLSRLLAASLGRLNVPFEVIDGDDIRKDLCRDLKFSKSDRLENIRRIGCLAQLLNRHNIMVIVAAISPYREARDQARTRCSRFLEIHVDCPIEILIKRDVKGFYKQAISGRLGNFSGISDPYEAPCKPDLYINTATLTEQESLARITDKLLDLKWIRSEAHRSSQRPALAGGLKVCWP